MLALDLPAVLVLGVVLRWNSMTSHIIVADGLISIRQECRTTCIELTWATKLPAGNLESL